MICFICGINGFRDNELIVHEVFAHTRAERLAALDKLADTDRANAREAHEVVVRSVDPKRRRT